MHCSQRESRRLVHKPPAAPRSRSTSRSRATESFSVLPPLSPQIPAPPRTPEPYRLTSNHARRDNGAFVILPEVSPPVRSRSPSPGGRASPFKIRTFRESTLPSRHTSREPSPERKSILKRKPILSSSPTRFPAKAPPSDNKRRQSLSPGRAIVVENNFKGQKHPRSKSTPRIPPPKISVTNNNSKDFLNRRKVSRSVSPARRKPGDNLSVNNKSKADFLTVEDLEDKENDLPNYKKETSLLNNKTHTKPKDPESSKPPLNPTSSPRKVNSKVQNNTTRKPLDNTSLGKIENSPNKANIPKSPRKGITKENNLKSPTRKGETRENDMSQRSKYTSGFNSQRTISPSRNSTLKKNASKTSMVAKPVSKQPVVPIRPTSINNEKKKEEDKKEYLKSEIGNEKEEEKEPMLPKENGKEKKVEESFETPKNGSLVQNNNNSITNNNNYINSPKKNSPKKEVTPKTSPTRKTTPVTPPSKSPKKLDPRKRSLTRDDTSKSLPVQDLIKPTAPVTLMRTSTAPALAPAHPDIANRVTTAVESHMSPKSPSRKVMNKRVNEQLSKVSEVSSISKESVRSSISTETMRAMGKESPRVKKNGMVQGTVKEEAEVEVLSANNLMRKDVATNNGHRNSAWDR